MTTVPFMLALAWLEFDRWAEGTAQIQARALEGRVVKRGAELLSAEHVVAHFLEPEVRPFGRGDVHERAFFVWALGLGDGCVGYGIVGGKEQRPIRVRLVHPRAVEYVAVKEQGVADIEFDLNQTEGFLRGFESRQEAIEPAAAIPVIDASHEV